MKSGVLSDSRGMVRWLVLLLVMGGVFLSTLDSGMVNIALPVIMRSFSVGLGQTNMVLIVYLLTITATLVFWGKISDRYGKGNVYLYGLLVFFLGAFGCAISSDFEKLLLSRFVQAIGASMMMSSGPAIIKTVFPTKHLGRGLGLVGIATASGLMSGPLISGLLITNFSWKAIFFTSMFVSGSIFFIGRVFLLQYLPKADSSRKGIKFDWQGSCCWAVMVVGFILLINRLPYGLSTIDFVGGIFFILMTLVFVKIEKKTANPIIPLGLVLKNYFLIALITAALSFAALFVVLILIPFYLQYVRQVSPDKIGFVVMALPATLIFVSPLSGYMYDKIGGRLLTTSGLIICTVALLGLSFLSADTRLWIVAANLALLGAGQSVFLSPNSASVLSRVSDQYAGITSGILATARNFGMVVGTTLATILFTFFLRYYGGGLKLEDYTVTDQVAFLSSLQATFIVVAVVLLLGSIVSSLRKS